jgi:hypothetical protein
MEKPSALYFFYYPFFISLPLSPRIPVEIIDASARYYVVVIRLDSGASVSIGMCLIFYHYFGILRNNNCLPVHRFFGQPRGSPVKCREALEWGMNMRADEEAASAITVRQYLRGA